MKNAIARLHLVACGGLLAMGAAQLHAQTIYRIIGPNKEVILTDKPPADVRQATAVNANGRPVATSGAALPYELRQAAEKYPVTLYSGAGCAPCTSGRLLLQGRGVPFTEFTVSTQEDADALQRISGDKSLPLLTIGGQKIKGFSEAEWTQFLSAANYPARSLLSANYRNPQAKPLVAVQKPEQAPERAAEVAEGSRRANQPAETEQPPQNTTSPSGIKF